MPCISALELAQQLNFAGEKRVKEIEPWQKST